MAGAQVRAGRDMEGNSQFYPPLVMFYTDQSEVQYAMSGSPSFNPNPFGLAETPDIDELVSVFGEEAADWMMSVGNEGVVYIPRGNVSYLIYKDGTYAITAKSSNGVNSRHFPTDPEYQNPYEKSLSSVS